MTSDGRSKTADDEALPLSPEAAFERAMAAHDEAVLGVGCEIWLGSEPTFTKADSYEPEWTTEALGRDKEARAQDLARMLIERDPRAVVLRTVGRQYPGEPRPRWSYGIYGPRGERESPWPRGVICDPLCVGLPSVRSQAASASPVATSAADLLDRFGDALVRELASLGAEVRSALAPVPGPLPRRVAYGELGQHSGSEGFDRPSVHESPIPDAGLSDALAERKIRLLSFGLRGVSASALSSSVGTTSSVPSESVSVSTSASPTASAGASGATLEIDRTVVIELPLFDSVPAFERFLICLASVLDACGRPPVILKGYPPPVDGSIQFTTVTPDPAVVEVNAAPHADLRAFYRDQVVIHESARRSGLSSLRMHYSGDIADSGGGGHLTFGGPRPEESPFTRRAHLLPGLVRYLNRHPALSYFFAVDCVGASSQSPRTDEGLRESFQELSLALELVAKRPSSDARTLWATLQPFMADHVGNTHRAEVNIEKLANPHLPGRGSLGLVELRALRMASSPEVAAAVAALFRSVCAMLARKPYQEPLIDWGASLHDRFALPFFLRRDLVEVLEDLRGAGLAIEEPLVARLDDSDRRTIGVVELPDGVTLRFEWALEFWPLLGDTASQERSAARWVDASSRRVCIVATAPSKELIDRLVVGVNGWRVPLLIEKTSRGFAGLRAFRYRAFVPSPGLHPSLPAEGSLRAVVISDAQATPADGGLEILMHAWRPAGGPYVGVPKTRDEAQARREERFVVMRAKDDPCRGLREVPAAACSRYSIDLRWLSLRP